METAAEGSVAKETVRLHRPCLQQYAVVRMSAVINRAVYPSASIYRQYDHPFSKR